MSTFVHAQTRTLLAPVLAAAVLVTTACAGSDSKAATTPKPQTPKEAATVLAERLSAGDLGDFPIKSGDPRADLTEGLQGMGGLRPSVKVADTIRNGNGATVNLEYTWPMAYAWTYTAKAVLANEDGQWKLVWKPDALHPQLSSQTRLERTAEDSSRAGVTGANNAVLVGPAPALMIGLDKGRVQGAQAEASARQLAELLLIDPQAYAERVAKAPDGVVVDAIGIHRGGLPAGGLDRIPGAVQREMTLPVGRDPGFARSIVGTVTTATAADAAASKGRVAQGDVIGRSGLQEKFEEQLRGGGASKVFLAPRSAPPGSTKPTSTTTVADLPARDGTPVASTIDAGLQSAAEDVLVTANTPLAVAAVRVKDGAILAAAESPVGKGRPDSTSGAFRPGTTGGPVAALAALRSGMKMSDKVTCDKSVTVGGSRVDRPGTVSAEGSMTLAQAIARGCSPALAGLAGRVQPQTYAEAAAALGVTGTPDLGFPARLGAVADTTSEGAHAQALAGTDTITASPLGLAAMAASVASGRPQSPWVTESLRPPAAGQLSGAEAKDLQALMEAGRSSVSVSGAQGALEATVDGKDVLVLYTKDVAYAVVVSDEKTAKTSAVSLISRMEAAAARSTTKSGSGSRGSGSSDD